MPNPITLSDNGVYNFSSNSSGVIRFNYGSSFPFGLEIGNHTVILNSLEVQDSKDGDTAEIRSEGDIVAFYSSDARLKDNITIISNPITKLKNLNGVMFDWNDNAPRWTKEAKWNGGSTHDIGVIAQEVQEILPEAVKTRKNGYLSVDYKRLIPLLIEGFKEQQKQIEILTERLEALENK